MLVTCLVCLHFHVLEAVNARPGSALNIHPQSPGTALATALFASIPAVPRRLTTLNRKAASASPHRIQMNAVSPDGKFKVTYFAAYGRVETARILLALSGQEFEDFRYPISFGTPGDFSTIHRPEFDADQAAGKFDYGMNMIPVIESGDFRLAQSKAIERYLAKKFGMMGGTLEEEAWVDAINEHVGDISAAFMKKDSEEQWFKESLPTYMRKLEAALPGTQGYAVGDKISLADVAIFRLLNDVQPAYDSKWDSDVSSAIAECPKISNILGNLEKNDALRKWMKERPKSTVE